MASGDTSGDRRHTDRGPFYEPDWGSVLKIVNEHTVRVLNAEDLRAEYAALTAYAQSTVSTRFTVAGLYMTASGFLAGAVFKDDPKIVSTRVALLAFACMVTISAWILELRTRHLLAILSQRARDIERNDWNIVHPTRYEGFASRQDPHLPNNLKEQRRREQFYMVLFWRSTSLPHWITRWISHSMGLDLLYMSGLLLWGSALVSQVWRLSHSFHR